MKKRKSTSLIIISLVGISIIVGGFIISHNIRKEITDHLIKEYAQQEHLIAVQLAQILELEISKREAELLLIAQLPEIVSGDGASCNKKLKEIYEDPQNKLGNLARVDENGFFKCSLNEKLIGIKAEKLGSYIADIFKDPEHKPVMSRAIKPAGADTYLIAIHVPVLNENGNFIGTVGGAIYLDDLKKEYLKGVEIANGGSVAIYDDDGTILNHFKPGLVGTNLASTNFQKLLKGAPSSEQAIEDIRKGTFGSILYSFEKVERVAAYEPIHIFPGRKWRIIVTLPTSTANDNIIKIGADKILTDIPVLLCVLISGIYALFVWVLMKKINPCG